jgi:type II secretory pathway component PulF
VVREPLIPALWTCVVRSAAPRGELATALSELARTYESRAENWVRMLRIVLGPMLLLLVGTFLGLVMTGIGATFAFLIQSLTNQ